MWSFSWPVANSLASEADRVQVPGLSSVSFTHKYAGVALTRLPTQGRHHPEVLMEDAVFRKARRGGHSSLHFILTVSGPNLHSGRPCLCQLFLERPGQGYSLPSEPPGKPDGARNLAKYFLGEPGFGPPGTEFLGN